MRAALPLRMAKTAIIISFAGIGLACASSSALAQPAPPPVPTEAAPPEPVKPPKADWFLHGFRLGYAYMNNIDGSASQGSATSINYKDRFGLKSPHMFL